MVYIDKMPEGGCVLLVVPACIMNSFAKYMPLNGINGWPFCKPNFCNPCNIPGLLYILFSNLTLLIDVKCFNIFLGCDMLKVTN